MPPETLRVWYQKHLDKDNPIKVLRVSQEERIKQLEYENNQLQRANEILSKAAVFFAQTELDRPHKLWWILFTITKFDMV